MSTEIIPDTDGHLPPLPRSASNAKPKGILKNAPPPPGAAQQSLRWDEANILSTEFPEGTFTKITEPKTPYVRYNAETDEVEGDIPNLDLSGRYFPASPVLSSSPSASGPLSGPSSRRTSFSSAASAGRSGSARSGSAQSSRSTSFNLPDEARPAIMDAGVGDAQPGEVEFDEEMDEETAKKHAEFVRARGRHYSNEAEAMRRAVQLMADEDADTDENDHAMEVPPLPRHNGRHNAENSEDNSLETATGRVSINGRH